MSLGPLGEHRYLVRSPGPRRAGVIFEHKFASAFELWSREAHRDKQEQTRAWEILLLWLYSCVGKSRLVHTKSCPVRHSSRAVPALNLTHHGCRQGWCYCALQTSWDSHLDQNKRLSKGKKGIKKKVVDPFTRKGMSILVYPSSMRAAHSTSQSGTTSRHHQSLRSGMSERLW